MAVNTKSGVVLAVGQPQQIQSKSGKTYTKRALFIDATTFDPYTGQRSQFENKLLFEFMEKRASVLDKVHVGDVVTVLFDIQGSEYKDQTGQTRYSINVRPYDVEVRPKPQYAPDTQPQQYAPQPQTMLNKPASADFPPSDMPF